MSRFLRREARTASEGEADFTDTPSIAEAQANPKLLTRNREVTRRKDCPKWRSPSNKPWSQWWNTPLSVRIGSYVELIEEVMTVNFEDRLLRRAC